MNEESRSNIVRQLKDVFVEAYLRPTDFSEMLSNENLVDLESLTTDQLSYPQKVSEYIAQMLSRGMIQQLIHGACNSRPGNVTLIEVSNRILVELSLAEWKPNRSGPPTVRDPSLEGPERVQVHRFDLRDLIDECITHLRGEKGLKAFLIPFYPEKQFSSGALLKNLCELLRDKLEDPRKIFINYSPLSLKPAFNSIPRSVQEAIHTLDKLSDGDVILAVTADDEQTALEFWEQLVEAHADVEFHYRGIILILVNTNAELSGSNSVVVLPSPECKRSDVYYWVKFVVGALQWPVEAITVWHWDDLIVQACTFDNTLVFLRIYDRLDRTLKHLKNNPSYDDFRSNYLERKRIP